MEVMGVFSSCVTAFKKLFCCSLRRISRTRKMVLRMSPAMMKPKKMTPRTNGTSWRQLRMIQLMLSTIAAAASDTPSVTKNAMAVLRLVMRMDEVRIAKSLWADEQPQAAPSCPRGLPLPRFRCLSQCHALLHGHLGFLLPAGLLQ